MYFVQFDLSFNKRKLNFVSYISEIQREFYFQLKPKWIRLHICFIILIFYKL